MVVVAGEDWTDAAQGSLVAFITTPLGSNEGAASLAIMPDGNVGIGTFNAIPTIADKLQVFGDIRVGTTGTNGCVKNFAGTGIDRHVLLRSPLQERHHAVRAGARSAHRAAAGALLLARRRSFPQRHFGNAKNYGLIAQDVEQVLPELVETDGDGYKAVDYSKLPLLTIQAVKELKAENDARKAENDALKQHVAELERLLTEMLAKQR